MDLLADTIDARMQALLRDPKTLDRDPRATIAPESAEPDEGSRALEVLRHIAPGSLEMGELIGEGGMGIVHRARQLTLDREVAVKTIKPEQKSHRSSEKLLREAWVTGSLEHPNVVPIYDVGLESDGSPHIVLKKIVGRAWSELMRDAKEVRRRFHSNDLLEWNLRVLMQVASAIHFAHRRGILHRDLKPDNVMIGDHGEIYVVDWGISVALNKTAGQRIPLAYDEIEMAGTPCYMAPEMLGGKKGLLSARTDISLLGSVLYEIVAGHPPHEGESIAEIVMQVAKGTVEVPQSAPRELARIIRVATDPDPDARFETAEQFRLAVGGFLEHRASMQISDEALARLDELLRERKSETNDPDEKRLLLYHLFGECRFGFLHALRAWPENYDARVGLQHAIEQMVEVELELGDPKAAGLLLAELSDAPEDLVERVAVAKRSYDEEEARRIQISADYDPRVGRRNRLFLGISMGAFWTLLPIAAFVAERLGVWVPDHESGIALMVILIVVYSIVSWVNRESMTKTVMNRHVVAIVGATLGTQLLLILGAHHNDVPMTFSLPLLPLLYSFAAAAAATSIDTRLWPSAVGFALAYSIGVLYYAALLPALALAIFGLTINIGLIWGHLEEDLLGPMQRRQQERRKRFREFLTQMGAIPGEDEREDD